MGQNFQPQAEVWFGDEPAQNVVVENSLIIKVITPPSAAPGMVDITIVNDDGQEGVLMEAFTYLLGPELDSLAPTSGPVTGGTPVSIWGANFTDGLVVTFGDVEALDVNVVDEGLLLCTTPVAEEGIVDVAVTNPDGQMAMLEQAFEFLPEGGPQPVLTEIYPPAGPETGGTLVTLTGENLDDPGATLLGDTPVTDYISVAPAEVVFETPASEPGIVDVTFISGGGQSVTLEQAFEYILEEELPSPPELLLVEPESGPTSGNTVVTLTGPSFGSGNGGEIVSVIGTGFMDGAQVYFGEEGAWVQGTNPLVKNLSTMISVVTPPHDAGMVDVRVVNTNQQEVVASGLFEFTEPQQLPPLAFVAALPNRTPVDGGIQVTISGKGFKSGIKVFFGNDPDWDEGTETQYLGPTILHTTVPMSPSGDQGQFDIMLLNPSAPGDPDNVIAEDAFSYTSGGVFELKGLRIPPDGRNDWAAEASDLNNDGLPDVYLSREGGSARGEVFINTAPDEWGFGGWFYKLTDLTDWNTSQPYMSAGDFDGDGDMDLIQRRADTMIMERNKGDATFGPYENKGWISWEARHFAVADFNCDGYLDIFVSTDSTSGSRANRILVNDGKGGFEHQTTNRLPAQYEYTEQAAAADVDLDGDIDLLLANNTAMQNRLYYNNCANIDLPPVCAIPMCTNYEYNGHVYAVCSDTRSWASAKSNCEQNGYDLAVINDSAEHNFLNSKLSWEAWIGYSDQDEEGQWKWYGDDSDYTF